MSRPNVIQVTMKAVIAQQMKDAAAREGNTVAALGRVFITKGLQELASSEPLTPDELTKAEGLYASGVCPSQEEAQKVVRLLRGSMG